MTNIAVPFACPVGTIRLDDATRADYAALARHHYRIRPPATFCIIRGAWHLDARAAGRDEPKLAGVAVLSWPVPMVRARLRHFHVSGGYGAALRFANAHVRTVSRVIVHPQYRALGIARLLIRDLIDRCPTRYVESSARMGEYVGCFVAAGMTRVEPRPDEPAYFVIDRDADPHERNP